MASFLAGMPPSVETLVHDFCTTYDRLAFTETLLRLALGPVPFIPTNTQEEMLFRAAATVGYDLKIIYGCFLQMPDVQVGVSLREVNAVQGEHVGGSTNGKRRTAPVALCTISNADQSAMVTTRPISVTYHPRVRPPVATTRCLPPQTALQTTAQTRRPFKPTHIFAQMFI
jgi:hypothetical protein